MGGPPWPSLRAEGSLVAGGFGMSLLRPLCRRPCGTCSSSGALGAGWEERAPLSSSSKKQTNNKKKPTTEKTRGGGVNAAYKQIQKGRQMVAGIKEGSRGQYTWWIANRVLKLQYSDTAEERNNCIEDI